MGPRRGKINPGQGDGREAPYALRQVKAAVT